MFKWLKKRSTQNIPLSEFATVYASPDIYEDRIKYLSTPTTIGRGPQCDIVIVNSSISREHCQIKRDAESSEYFIRDLGSYNGTYVNNVRINNEWIPLKIGDVVKIGSVSYSFEKKVSNLDTLKYTPPKSTY